MRRVLGNSLAFHSRGFAAVVSALAFGSATWGSVSPIMGLVGIFV